MTFKYFLTGLLTVVAITVAAQNEINIERVSVINVGDGRMLFRDADSEKPLDGEHRIIDGYRSEYILAQFKDGMYDGSYSYFKYNKLVEEGSYKEGHKDGSFKEYFSDGTSIKNEKFYMEGKADGIWRTYYVNGALGSEKGYKNGLEHGPEKQYGQETGKLKLDNNYVDGKRHGRQISYQAGNSGEDMREANYTMGMLDGLYCETLANGTVREKGNYKNNKKEGKWIFNRRDGKLEKEITYKEGKQDGETRTYFTDGTLESIVSYANDKKNGLTTTYDFNTQKIKSERNYVDGKEDGAYKLYYEDGTLQEEGRRENNQPVYRKNFYKNGKVESIQERTRTGWETTGRYNEKGESTLTKN